MNILVTGGAGYIGSHTCAQLIMKGHTVTILDDLSNSSDRAVGGIEKVAGKKPRLVVGNVLDESLVLHLFSTSHFGAVLHFAARKSLQGSIADPLDYFHTNVAGTLSLLRAMQQKGVRCLVFSSSAAVYGSVQKLPICEGASLAPTNPYGQSKLMVETILARLCASDPEWRVAVLRYFNPVGAHPSGLIGEDPINTPSNLLPMCLNVALGIEPSVPIFGQDYPTEDGSAIRDFIHVMDLADGHLAALEFLASRTQGGLETVNLGTGRGVSVRQMICAVECAIAARIATTTMPRRPGDVPICFADVSHAERLLGWRASLDLDAMCRDAWLWRRTHPHGYRDASRDV